MTWITKELIIVSIPVSLGLIGGMAYLFTIIWWGLK